MFTYLLIALLFVLAFLSTCVSVVLEDRSHRLKTFAELGRKDWLTIALAFGIMLVSILDKSKSETKSDEQNATVKTLTGQLDSLSRKISGLETERKRLPRDLAEIIAKADSASLQAMSELIKNFRAENKSAPPIFINPSTKAETQSIINAIRNNARVLADQIGELRLQLATTETGLQDSLKQKTAALSGQLSTADKGIKEKLNRAIKDVIEQLE